jgi:hypothetical protein
LGNVIDLSLATGLSKWAIEMKDYGTKSTYSGPFSSWIETHYCGEIKIRCLFSALGLTPECVQASLALTQLEQGVSRSQPTCTQYPLAIDSKMGIDPSGSAASPFALGIDRTAIANPAVLAKARITKGRRPRG